MTRRRITQIVTGLTAAVVFCAAGAPAADDAGADNADNPARTAAQAQGGASGQENRLSPREKADGWVLLFDGQSPAGWTAGDKPMPAANVQRGAINPHDAGAYVTYYKEPFGDFVLSCDFKVDRGANSGIFFRVGDKKDPVQTGIEFQVYDSAGRANPGRNGAGAIYDLQAPSSNSMKPIGEWNHVEITADKNVIQVVLNGKQIIDMDTDRWTQPRKNPDGTENKFAKPLKDFPRSGYLGLQDHGDNVWYRNIKVKPLKKK